jgi:uncharacterized protein (TIGR02118 family)
VDKLFVLVKRPNGAERSAFCDELLRRAENAASEAEIAGLVVNLVDVPPEEAGLRPGGEPSYDAAVEIWLEDGPNWPRSMPFALPGTLNVYLVRETLERAYERDWPIGERSPGVKSIYLARRSKDMTQEDYAAYWADRHAPLALKVHVGMWRYERNVVVASAAGNDKWDGFAVLHFRTAEDLRERFYDSDAGRAAIAADVSQFTSGGRVLHTSEHILKG